MAEMTSRCPGPLIWHDVDGDPPAALLECRCGYVIATGQVNDPEHADTEIVRSVA